MKYEIIVKDRKYWYSLCKHCQREIEKGFNPMHEIYIHINVKEKAIFLLNTKIFNKF